MSLTHLCPDWDFMAIGLGDPEMEGCTCSNIKKGKAMSADKSETVGKVKTYHNPCHETHGHHLVENEGSGWVSLHDYRQLERKLAAAHEKIAKMRKSQSEPVMWGISINDHIYSAEFHKAFAEQKIQASKDAEGQYPSRYEIVPLVRALKE